MVSSKNLLFFFLGSPNYKAFVTAKTKIYKSLFITAVINSVYCYVFNIVAFAFRVHYSVIGQVYYEEINELTKVTFAFVHENLRASH